MERKLIAATGSKADSLEDWLLNDFFAQHCDLFHSRPFCLAPLGRSQGWLQRAGELPPACRAKQRRPSHAGDAGLCLPRRLDHPAEGRRGAR